MPTSAPHPAVNGPDRGQAATPRTRSSMPNDYRERLGGPPFERGCSGPFAPPAPGPHVLPGLPALRPGRRGRDPQDEPGAPVAVLDGERPVVEPGDLAGDRQPETGPSGVPFPARLQAGETLEDHLPVLLGDARAVVEDFQHGVPVLVAHGDVDPRLGVPLG